MVIVVAPFGMVQAPQGESEKSESHHRLSEAQNHF
jgi:hypothetical protein